MKRMGFLATVMAMVATAAMAADALQSLTVKAVKGNVTVQSGGTGAFAAAAKDATFPAGSVVVAGEKSSATIEMDKIGTVKVGASTRATFVSDGDLVEIVTDGGDLGVGAVNRTIQVTNSGTARTLMVNLRGVEDIVVAPGATVRITFTAAGLEAVALMRGQATWGSQALTMGQTVSVPTRVGGGVKASPSPLKKPPQSSVAL